MDDEEIKEVRRLLTYLEVAIGAVAFVSVSIVVSLLICVRGS